MMRASSVLLCGAMALSAGMATAASLTFKTHALAALCFSASSMKLTYGGYRTAACPTLAREKVPYDDVRLASAAVSLRAYAGPLQVEWVARDGSPLSTTLDLEKVFKGRTVLHREDPVQIDPSLPILTDPMIVVEVNDKTLTIYMDVDVGLFTDEPGKLRRGSRNRLIAFQKSFD